MSSFVFPSVNVRVGYSYTPCNKAYLKGRCDLLVEIEACFVVGSGKIRI